MLTVRWILFPPVLSIFVFAASYWFGNREYAEDFPSIVWSLTISVYICLCGISAAHLLKNDRRSLSVVACLAQGLLLSVLGVNSGARSLAWVGLLIFLSGLFIAFLSTTHEHSVPDIDLTSQHIPVESLGGDVSTDQLFSKFGLPIATTDESGSIEEATNEFMEALDLRPEQVLGETITNLISGEEGEIDLPTGKWYLRMIKQSAHCYFLLNPTQDGRPQIGAATARPAAAEVIFVDEQSGLYPAAYRAMRGAEEVARSQKFKRPLCGVLAQLSFEMATGVSLSGEQKDMLIVAFLQKVKEILRDTDCGFLTDDRDTVLLLLPETQQQGAKSLITRLQTLPQDVFEEDIRSAVGPRVTAAMHYNSGANSGVDFDSFMVSLEQAFAGAKI